MGIFGKENYSREAYEKGEKELKDTAKSVHVPSGHRAGHHKGSWLDNPETRKRVEERNKRYAEVEKRLKKLMESGQKEAIGLNEEYAKLKRAAEEAERNLHAFEVEKLGMQVTAEEGTREDHEGEKLEELREDILSK